MTQQATETQVYVPALVIGRLDNDAFEDVVTEAAGKSSPGDNGLYINLNQCSRPDIQHLYKKLTDACQKVTGTEPGDGIFLWQANRIRAILSDHYQKQDWSHKNPMKGVEMDPSTALRQIMTESIVAAAADTRIGLQTAEIEELVEKHVEEAARRSRIGRPILEIRFKDDRKVIVEGQHDKFPDLMHCIAMRHNTLLVGPTGSGKTHACIEAAKVLGIPDDKVFLINPLCDRFEAVGHRDLKNNYVETMLYKFCTTPGAMLIFDEIEKNWPKVIPSVNPIFSNGWVTFPHKKVKVPDENIVVATANTFGTSPDAEYTGASKQDASVMNRFPKVIFWDYDEDLEARVSLARGGDDETVRFSQKIRAALNKLGITLHWSPRDTFALCESVAAGRELMSALAISRFISLDDDQRKAVLMIVNGKTPEGTEETGED